MRLSLLLPLLALLAPLRAEPAKLAFIRTQSDAAASTLQTLSAEYKSPHGGPSVWLIGVAHVGTREYFTSIQKRLDTQSAVLYEGVDGEKLKTGAKADAGIQTQLANALGLTFQLDAIDYQRPHFINSDLTVEKLNHAITRRAEPAPQPADAPVEKVDGSTFKTLMDAIHGEGDMAESIGGMIGMLGSTPEMQETTKVLLIEALGQAGELIEVAKAASPELKDLFDVLITERNAEVIRQLDAQLARLRPGQSVAVFYGAAHMDEIARRLTADLHFQPAAQQWDTAFSADAKKSILPPAQIKGMIQMLRAQMQNPNAGSGGGIPLLNLLAPPAKK